MEPSPNLVEAKPNYLGPTEPKYRSSKVLGHYHATYVLWCGETSRRGGEKRGGHEGRWRDANTYLCRRDGRGAPKQAGAQRTRRKTRYSNEMPRSSSQTHPGKSMSTRMRPRTKRGRRGDAAMQGVPLQAGTNGGDRVGAGAQQRWKDGKRGGARSGLYTGHMEGCRRQALQNRIGLHRAAAAWMKEAPPCCHTSSPAASNCQVAPRRSTAA